jgi:hypothetical protein
LLAVEAVVPQAESALVQVEQAAAVLVKQQEQ